MPDVSVLVINYNGLIFLDDCFRSVNNAFTRYTYEIIVVDNSSRDGSQEYLRGRKDIVYIESTANTGFTGGNNIAARRARGRILLLLNHDTIIQGSRDELIDRADQENNGVVGCKLVYEDGIIQKSVGYEHTAIRIVLWWIGLGKYYFLPSIFRCQETSPKFYDTEHTSVNWVSGACMATKAELWLRLGGLDEGIFMYCEDVDYCKRARDSGYKVAYTNKSTVTHFEHSGRTWAGTSALTNAVRSYMYIVKKHGTTAEVLFLRYALSLVYMTRSVIYNVFKMRHGADKALAYKSAALILLHGE